MGTPAILRPIFCRSDNSNARLPYIVPDTTTLSNPLVDAPDNTSSSTRYKLVLLTLYRGWVPMISNSKSSDMRFTSITYGSKPIKYSIYSMSSLVIFNTLVYTPVASILKDATIERSRRSNVKSCMSISKDPLMVETLISPTPRTV